MTNLQIRNVPDDVLRALKTRASAAGQSLSEFALMELTRTARRPTLDELTERVRLRGEVQPRTRAADALREERQTGAA